MQVLWIDERLVKTTWIVLVLLKLGPLTFEQPFCLYGLEFYGVYLSIASDQHTIFFTTIAKECLNELSTATSSMINLSLEQGHFSDVLKGVLVQTKLTKSGLELEKKNYRPVSNLQLLSKLPEK